NGCASSASVTITEPAILTANIIGTNVDCNGDCNGAADLTVTGGTTPYSYIWSSTETTEDLSNICAGIYCVTVTDENLCTATACITITEPASPLSAIITGTNLNCNGDSSGVVDLTVSGGTLPYSYLWSGGDTIDDLTNIPAGSYCVTIIFICNSYPICSCTKTA
ncbi:unnamed protein product, partial [marine sediment metagenome]